MRTVWLACLSLNVALASCQQLTPPQTTTAVVFPSDPQAALKDEAARFPKSEAIAELDQPLPFSTAGVAATKQPVILIQGYMEPSWYFMWGVKRHLQKTGHPAYGINLAPNIGDADKAARKLAQYAEKIHHLHNQKVTLIGHSFGGLIARHYLQHLGGVKTTDRLVTIATPHLGTYVAYLGPGQGGVQMRPGSTFLDWINQDKVPVPVTCIWTKTDEIVVPPRNSILPGATVKDPVPWVGHLLILFHPKTYRYLNEALQ